MYPALAKSQCRKPGLRERGMPKTELLRRTLLGSSVNSASLLQTIKTPACSEDMRRQYPLRLLGCLLFSPLCFLFCGLCAFACFLCALWCFLFPFLCFLFCCLRAFSCFLCHSSLLLFRNTAETLPLV